MNKLTIIEDSLEGFRGDACLVMDAEGNFFVVSTVTKAQFAHAYGAIETLAFLADEEGSIVNWTEVAGGGDMSREDVLAQLEEGDWDVPDLDDYADMFDVDDYVGDDEDWSEYLLNEREL